MNIAFKYGLMTGISIALWNALNYFLLYQTFIGRFSFLIDTVLLITILWVGMNKAKRVENSGQISFARAGLTGVQLSLVAAIALAVITFGFSNVPNPKYHQYVTQQLETALKNNPAIKAQADFIDLQKSFSPEQQAKSAALTTFIIGTVISFIIAMIIRNKVPDHGI